ncbi:hypothetical protein D3C77_78390 [compost metagenome]
MHGLRGVFGNAQGLELRQVQVHFRRCFGARGQLEFKLDARHGAGLVRLADQVAGLDQGDAAAGGQRLADPGVDLALGAARQVQTELVLGATAHGVAGVDVLAHHVFHEAAGGEHLDLAGLDVGLVDHPAHAAKMIGMAVAVDHRHHRFARAVLVVQLQRGAGGFGGGQRVDDDQPVVAFDEGHVGQVQATHLVQPRRYFEQASVGVELGQAPEAGVDAVGAVLRGEEFIALKVPHRFAGGIADLAVERRDQAAGDCFVIGAVAEGQLRQHGGIAAAGLFAGTNRCLGGMQGLAQAGGSNQAGQARTRVQG